MEENVTKQKAGVFALICSFFFPIVGIIIYFVNKKNVENPSSYLWAALGGFIVGFILRMLAGAY